MAISTVVLVRGQLTCFSCSDLALYDCTDNDTQLIKVMNSIHHKIQCQFSVVGISAILSSVAPNGSRVSACKGAVEDTGERGGGPAAI